MIKNVREKQKNEKEISSKPVIFKHGFVYVGGVW
jgi:hypothetical protein